MFPFNIAIADYIQSVRPKTSRAIDQVSVTQNLTSVKSANESRGSPDWSLFRFLYMKQLRIFLLPPGQNASPSQGYPHLGRERHCWCELTVLLSSPDYLVVRVGALAGENCVVFLAKTLHSHRASPHSYVQNGYRRIS